MFVGAGPCGCWLTSAACKAGTYGWSDRPHLLAGGKPLSASIAPRRPPAPRLEGGGPTPRSARGPPGCEVTAAAACREVAAVGLRAEPQEDSGGWGQSAPSLVGRSACNPDSALPRVGLGDCPQTPPGGGGTGACGVTGQATCSAGSWAPPAVPVGGRAGSAERAVPLSSATQRGRVPALVSVVVLMGGSPRTSTGGG